MSHTDAKFIIIGAGLSGLTTAYRLLESGEDNFIILEGRKRIGGRIRTKDHIDLGATWFQGYHSHLLQLVDDLGLTQFDQYSTGKSVLVYNEKAPPHIFESDPNTPSAHRIAGGSIALINALSQSFNDKIVRNATVTGVSEGPDTVTIKSASGSYTCEHVIVTVPPKIAAQITYIPELPQSIVEAMKETHTWMSNAIKVGITYKNPFWRDQGLSGTVIGQNSPVIELYDHSDDTKYSLMGFVHEAMRETSAEDRKEEILTYLEKHLGGQVRQYLNYYEKDWSQDTYTTQDLKPLYMAPQYGHALFQDFYMGGKILFSGAETSPVYGGYMEGALYSGLNSAQKLLNYRSLDKQ
jgi:monoamine oxidase